MQLIPTKNSISIGVAIHDPKITEAKTYLKIHFNSKYDLDPHFNFVIMAMPQNRIPELEKALDIYFKNKPAIKLELGKLQFEPKTKFFSIPIVGSEVIQVHKELLNILNPLRGPYIRERDLTRMNENKTTPQENQYIEKYGYLRVLDLFKPQISIGNIQTDCNVDVSELEDRLNEILSALYFSYLPVKKVYATFAKAAEIQSDYKFLWEKEYFLTSA